MCVYVHMLFFVYDNAQPSSDVWNIFRETQDSIGKLKNHSISRKVCSIPSTI